MPTFYEFNTLSEDEKAEQVWSGTFLATRSENGNTIQLVSLNNFYVEVYYEPLEIRIIRFRDIHSGLIKIIFRR